MSLRLSDFYSPQGRVGRAKYVLFGTLLFALKHNIDRITAAVFGYRWSVFNYWIYNESLLNLEPERIKFFGLMLLLALPFVWLGVILTLRRLRDANLPGWMVLFFFVPFLNLLFFLLLSIIPSATSEAPAELSATRRFLHRMIPDSELGSAALGVLVTSVLAVGFTVLSIYGLASYGWGLFVGVPFFLGLNSVLIYGFHQPRTVGRCLLVSWLAVIFAAFALVAIAIEGTTCLVMAAPLAAAMGILGGFVGFLLQQRNAFQPQTLHMFSIVLLLPLLMLLEHDRSSAPVMYEVRTAVVINASPETVWENVVEFSELPPPNHWLFKTGIAYPLRAEIDGRGVGAIRHCVFSTGAFVEPLTVWQPPRLLRFGVTAQPPVMKEWSPYQSISPPHLENYLVSRQGEFLITALPNGRTLLEGTTWYENRFWPGAYWRLWSDFIIHRIHLRVLDHVKQLSEH